MKVILHVARSLWRLLKIVTDPWKTLGAFDHVCPFLGQTGVFQARYAY